MPVIESSEPRKTGTRENGWASISAVNSFSEDLRPRGHHLARHLVAELHHRPHQLAVGLLQNSLFLPGFKQRVHGLGGMLVFGGVLRLGQRHDRKQQPQQQRDGQDEVEQRLQHEADFGDPQTLGADEQNLRDQPVEDQDQQHQLEDGARNFLPAGPRGQLKLCLPDREMAYHRGGVQAQAAHQRDAGERELPKNRSRLRNGLAAQAQPGLDLFLP
jgi:hypothetical protein